MTSDQPLCDPGTALYRRLDGAVVIRYSHLNDEDGFQYGYLYDVVADEAISQPMPLAAFLKFDVFEVIDDPAIKEILGEDGPDWDEPIDGDPHLVSILVKDDEVKALWFETAEEEGWYRVAGQWQGNPGGADIDDAEENFVDPSRLPEVVAIFDRDPQQLLDRLGEFEADEEQLREVLPLLFDDHRSE